MSIYKPSHTYSIPFLKFSHLLPPYSKHASLLSIPLSFNFPATSSTIAPLLPFFLSPLNSQYITPPSPFTAMNSAFASAHSGESYEMNSEVVELYVQEATR
jgi:hypothetical protein